MTGGATPGDRPNAEQALRLFAFMGSAEDALGDAELGWIAPSGYRGAAWVAERRISRTGLGQRIDTARAMLKQMEVSGWVYKASMADVKEALDLIKQHSRLRNALAHAITDTANLTERIRVTVRPTGLATDALDPNVTARLVDSEELLRAVVDVSWAYTVLADWAEELLTSGGVWDAVSQERMFRALQRNDEEE